MLAGPVAWIFGGEAHGIPAAVAERADHRVRVPIHGRAESLNLATAAAVCLYASVAARAVTGDGVRDRGRSGAATRRGMSGGERRRAHRIGPS